MSSVESRYSEAPDSPRDIRPFGVPQNRLAKAIISSIPLLALLAAAPTSQPINLTLLKQMHAIDIKVAKLHDFTADFTQDKFTPLLKRPLKSAGHVIGSGDRTLWITESPEPTRMAVDSSGIHIFYPNQHVVEIYPLQGQLASLASSPIPRLNVLKKFFRFEPLKSSPTDANFLAIKLVPTDATIAQHVQEVDVVLDKSTGIIRSATNIDGDGDRTVLTFTHVKTNTNLPPAALKLNLPPGTKTVHPLQGMGNTAP